MTRIIMAGCNGRMGKVISSLCEADETVTIVAGIDICDDGNNSYKVYNSYAELDVEADVIIDFSTPKLLKDMLKYSMDKNVPAVICTTGYSDNEIEAIKEASRKVAILRSGNMSLGINTLVKIMETISKTLAEAGFDIEIVEKHHNQKVDAPSGTALLLADTINHELNDEMNYKYDRTCERAKREKKEIGISAVRGGTIVGEHEVIFAGTDEVIEIKHTAYSRAIFGKGAISAAKFLADKANGMYSMKDVIDN